jgi:hypothetical protein
MAHAVGRLLGRRREWARNSRSWIRRSALYRNGKPEREGFEPSIPLDAVYRISRPSERGAGWGTDGHSVFKFAALRAPQGRRRHPRWVCVGIRIGCAWSVQWARGAHIQASARPSNPGQVTGRSCDGAIRSLVTELQGRQWVQRERGPGQSPADVPAGGRDSRVERDVFGLCPAPAGVIADVSFRCLLGARRKRGRSIC